MSNRTAVVLLACTLTVIVALLAAAAAGYLARHDHATYPAALIQAAKTFTATLMLAAALAAAVATVCEVSGS